MARADAPGAFPGAVSGTMGRMYESVIERHPQVAPKRKTGAQVDLSTCHVDVANLRHFRVRGRSRTLFTHVALPSSR